MASPFPGMDPYLEGRAVWSGFHYRLANEIADRLTADIGPKYYADVEVHSVVEEVLLSRPRRSVYPDVAVVEPAGGSAVPIAVPDVPVDPAPLRRLAIEGQSRLRAVQIFLTETDELVTVIEILSPYNKRANGLVDYRRKRREILRSSVHLLELDLLRGGERPGREVQEPPLPEEYVLLLSRAHLPQRVSEIWPVALNQRLPRLPVPLLSPDPDVALDLNEAVKSVYARAGYAWRIDYSQPLPPPPLRPEMAAWLQQIVSPQTENPDEIETPDKNE